MEGSEAHHGPLAHRLRDHRRVLHRHRSHRIHSPAIHQNQGGLPGGRPPTVLPPVLRLHGRPGPGRRLHRGQRRAGLPVRLRRRVAEREHRLWPHSGRAAYYEQTVKVAGPQRERGGGRQLRPYSAAIQHRTHPRVHGDVIGGAGHRHRHHHQRSAGARCHAFHDCRGWHRYCLHFRRGHVVGHHDQVMW